MFLMKRSARMALLFAAAIMLTPAAYAKKNPASISGEDEVFQALRDAARRDDTAQALELATSLSEYTIPSYVDYYSLKPRLRSASAEEILDFLARHDGSAIADRLRNDWLLELGHQRDWTTFDQQYPLFVLDDDLQVKCFALMSKISKGGNAAAEARALLTSPKDYGEACNALLAMLSQSGQFTKDDVWMQLRLAAEQGAVASARRMSALVGASEREIVRALNDPARALKQLPGKSRESRELYIIALGRMARNDLQKAAGALKAASKRLTASEQALGWAQIALRASYKLAPETLAEYWNKTDGAPLSDTAHEWKVRIALREGDWKRVKAGIEAMPASLRSDHTWVYWRSRALREEGRLEEANRLLLSIAEQMHFYGQLAREELGRKITAPPPPQPLTDAELAKAAANPGFRRAKKFFDMGLRFEGVREWNWELRKMNERELLAAAEFARQQRLLDRMVNTSDRTRGEMDFTQRYPSPFHDIMQNATQVLGLDIAWVYGLIRQESRFILDARSHAGASGLMQLMPATARYVARKIGMDDFQPSKVNDTHINIQLGTSYLSMVLNDLDGSQALASAAYNAGPSRSRAWRATLPGPVEGAVFAETIPFTETRGYVKNVLANATYYAALFEGKPQSLKARLGTVAPKGYVETELP
jgi:soluble lytic murein transglycosylase